MTEAWVRRAGLALVAAAVALGAWLRLDGLGEPSLWLDELLNVGITAAAPDRPWYDWVGGFVRENGPLYYAAQLAASPVDDPEAAARLAPAVAGIAALLLMAAVGHRLAGGSGAVAASALLAVSPLHVYYSREGRTYALLMLLALVVLIGLLERRSARRAALLVAGGAVMAAYTAATAAPLLATLGLVGGGLWLRERRRGPASGVEEVSSARRAAARAAVAGALLGLALVAGLYGRFRQSEPVAAFDLSATEAVSRWATAFTVSALDGAEPSAACLLLLGAAGLGAVALARREPRAAWVLAGMAVLPPLVALAVLAALDHWLSVRYLSPGLPAFVALAAVGVDAFGRGAARLVAGAPARAAWVRRAAVLAVAVALAVPGFGAARHEPYRKTDWRHAAELIEALGRPGEPVLAGNPWSAVSLGFYLDRSFSVTWIADPGEAERRARRAGAAWLVHAGYPSNGGFRRWMARWPEVWRSAPEGAVLAFHPDLGRLRRNRGGEALERLPLRLGLDGTDPYFLGSGWSPVRRQAEPGERGERRSFRWLQDRRAWLLLPLPDERPLELTLVARPAPRADGAAPLLALTLNEVSVGTMPLAPGWQRYSLELPAGLARAPLDRLDFEVAGPPEADAPRIAVDQIEVAARR